MSIQFSSYNAVRLEPQCEILLDYAHKKGYLNTQVFADDGYSGTSFDRPDFLRMERLIEEGKVATVIVKDLSRFGRNYLDVGNFLEILFPQKDVCFLAINNNIDSNNASDNDFTPFMNIMKNIRCLGKVFLQIS